MHDGYMFGDIVGNIKIEYEARRLPPQDAIFSIAIKVS